MKTSTASYVQKWWEHIPENCWWQGTEKYEGMSWLVREKLQKAGED